MRVTLESWAVGVFAVIACVVAVFARAEPVQPMEYVLLPMAGPVFGLSWYVLRSTWRRT